MRSTPTTAMEVILNLPLIHIYIQEAARFTVHRLLHSQVPISKSHDTDYKKLLDELNEAPLLGMLCDAMVQKFNLDRKYQVIIPDKDWETGTLVRADSNWYTDGCKTDYGVGAGIHAKKPKKALSVSFSKDTTVFQAEVAQCTIVSEK